MKSRVLILLVAGLLAACSDNTPVDQGAASPASGPADTSLVQADCVGEGFYSPLPAGVTVSFPFHFRIDRISPNSKGKMNRRVVLEIVEGDTAAAFESAKQSLLDAGYRLNGEPKGDPAKKQLQKFKKEGSPAITLKSDTNVGKKPSNPAAIGVVYFDWLVPDAAQPESDSRAD